MKAPLLPLATAVLGIAVGFIGGKVGGAGGDAAAGDGAAERRNGPNTRQGSSRGTGSGGGAGGQRSDSSADVVLSNFLKGQSVSEISAEEAFALLKPQMNMDWNADPLEAARLNYQYQLLASKLPLKVMEGVLTLARESGVQGYRANQLFGAYAARDWEKAMVWAETQPDSATLRGAAISRLALNDPVRAAELYQDLLMTGETRSAWDTSYTVASNYAKLGQKEFFKFLDSLPSGSVSSLVSNGARTLPKEDVPAFLKEIQLRTEQGKIESWTMNNLISNMAGAHSQEVWKWLDTMEPGGKRAELELSLASNLSRQGKSDEVDALLASAMAGAEGKEKEFVKDRARNFYGQSPEVVEKLVALLPEDQKLTREDVKDWANYSYGRTDTVLEVAKYIHSPEEQAAYLVDSFNKMGNASGGGRKLNARDFEILSNRLSKMNLSANAMAQARTALDSARDSALGK